jgi:hypothetical protein
MTTPTHFQTQKLRTVFIYLIYLIKVTMSVILPNQT